VCGPCGGFHVAVTCESHLWGVTSCVSPVGVPSRSTLCLSPVGVPLFGSAILFPCCFAIGDPLYDSPVRVQLWWVTTWGHLFCILYGESLVGFPIGVSPGDPLLGSPVVVVCVVLLCCSPVVALVRSTVESHL
jgi:hypothetical protein